MAIRIDYHSQTQPIRFHNVEMDDERSGLLPESPSRQLSPVNETIPAASPLLDRVLTAEQKSLLVDFPVFEFSDIQAVFDILIDNQVVDRVPGFLISDSDKTLRDTLLQGFSGRFGRLRQKILDQLVLIRQHWPVLVVSNQPENGHQVAAVWLKAQELLLKLQPRLPHFPVVPHSLRAQDIQFFGGGNDFLVRKYKQQPEAVERAALWMARQYQKRVEADPSLAKQKWVIMAVGDKEADVEYYRRVAYYTKVLGLPFVWQIIHVGGKNQVTNNLETPRDEAKVNPPADLLTQKFIQKLQGIVVGILP